MHARKWILSALLLLPAAGCASLSDFHYEQTQRSRARAAWRDHGGQCKQDAYARDYEAGWKDGFYDVATGGKGCPPVVAPCSYWKPSQILEDHDRARNTYYNGFQDGVACALRYPQTHYLKLWSSCECPGLECAQPCTGVEGCGCGACSSPRMFFEGGEGLSEMSPMPLEYPQAAVATEEMIDSSDASTDLQQPEVTAPAKPQDDSEKSDAADKAEPVKAESKTDSAEPNAAETPAATETPSDKVEVIPAPSEAAVAPEDQAEAEPGDKSFRIIEAKPLNLSRTKVKPTVIRTTWTDEDDSFGGMIVDSEINVPVKSSKKPK